MHNLKSGDSELGISRARYLETATYDAMPEVLGSKHKHFTVHTAVVKYTGTKVLTVVCPTAAVSRSPTVIS